MSGLVALAALVGSAMPAAAASAPPSAPPSAATALILSGKISCGSAKACLAVGVTAGLSTASTAAAAWNGTTWKSITVHAPKGARFVILDGVSCKSSAYCLLAGEYLTGTQSAHFRPFALTWNGTSLRPAPRRRCPGALRTAR